MLLPTPFQNNFPLLTVLPSVWNPPLKEFVCIRFQLFLSPVLLPSAAWQQTSCQLLTRSLALTHNVCMTTKLAASSFFSKIWVPRRWSQRKHRPQKMAKAGQQKLDWSAFPKASGEKSCNFSWASLETQHINVPKSTHCEIFRSKKCNKI